MDKILKNINTYKEMTRDIEVYGSTPVLTVENNFPQISKAYLRCDDIIKIAKISFEGVIASIYADTTNGVYLKYFNNAIRIINFNKHKFNNDLLFYFIGNITNIKKGNVKFWAATPQKGIIFENAEIEIINKNDNVINTDDYSFKDDDIKTNLKINKQHMLKPLSFNINSLYTKGNQYMLPSGRFYKGYYHYSTRKKIYRTRRKEDDRSVNLKQRLDLKRVKNKRNIKVGGLGNPDPRKPRI